MASTLRGTDRPLADLHDVALLDLDGVVYVGPQAVPGAPEALAQARERGVRLAFVTNNAARPPSAVAEHLTELGIAADADEVITSSQAAARYLAEHLPAGSQVLVLGTTGLIEALHEQGLTPVDEAADEVQAVVQGYSPTMNWALLAEGAVAINRDVLWVATNVDPTVPSPRGPLPGNGALVAAMKLATRRDPVVTGKPDPTMHRETLLRTGAERPIVVGDRLDTDIEGANEVGCDSLLVLSGVTTGADLLAAPRRLRPTYLAADVSGLLDAHEQPRSEDGTAICGRWTAAVDGDDLRLELSSEATGKGDRSSGEQPSGKQADHVGDVHPGRDALDALRALCAAQWDRGDDGTAPRVRSSGSDSAEVLNDLGLSA